MSSAVLTHDEALEILEKVSLGLQRYRSISFESSKLTEEQMAMFEPYAFGKGSLLPKIQSMLDRRQVIPMEFYNIMYLLNHLRPELGAAICVTCTAAGENFTLPSLTPNDLGQMMQNWPREELCKK